jgi:hypothetical protein
VSKTYLIFRRQCPHCKQLVEYIAGPEYADRSKPMIPFTTRCANRKCNMPIELAAQHLTEKTI